MAEVVVVGAGMGGMAAAARLSVKRHSVTVVEQSSTYGGKVATFERDGFVPNVVFPTAVVADSDNLLIYYGASDTFTAVAAFSQRELLATLIAPTA